MQRPWWQRLLLSAWVRPVLLVLVLLVVWDLTIRLFRIPPYLIPSPWSVVQQLGAEWPRLLKESIPTTYATLGGFALSIAFGIPMALVIAYSRTVESFVYPLLVFSQSVPKIAIAPLFVVWFGFGMEPKVLITSVITFFPLLVNSIAGARSVDVDRLELAKSLGASRWQTFAKITFPSSLPFIFAGLNMAAVLSILGAIVGEFVGAQSGLGVLILQYNSNLDIASVYSLLVVLAAMGLTMHFSMRYLERRFCFWAQRSRESAATEIV